MSIKPSDFPTGKFFESYHGFGGATWTLNKDHTFFLDIRNCTGGEQGGGTYNVKKDSIHFLFTQMGDTSYGYSRILINKSETDSGDWKIKLHLRDRATQEDIVFAAIELLDSTGNQVATCNSDIDGRAQFSLKSDLSSLKLKIIYLGYYPIEYALQKKGSYELTCEFSSSIRTNYIASGTKYDFKLISVSKDKMIWQTSYPPIDGNGNDSKVKFELDRTN